MEQKSDLSRIANAAGLDEKAIAYLAAKGLDKIKFLAKCALNEEEFKKKTVDPYILGVTIN